MTLQGLHCKGSTDFLIFILGSATSVWANIMPINVKNKYADLQVKFRFEGTAVRVMHLICVCPRAELHFGSVILPLTNTLNPNV